MYTLTFNLNYDTPNRTLCTLEAEPGKSLPIQLKPMPQRDGYRFAGWYTTPKWEEGSEYLFGQKLSAMWPQPVVADEMAVNSNLTLYARWEAPRHIQTLAQLIAIRENLKGWYVLDNDIDAAEIEDWNPIGFYDPTYEWSIGEWWTEAFQGHLDGAGHSIKNLNLSVKHACKAGFFGTLANACVENLTFDSPRCVISNGDSFSYVGILVALAKHDNRLLIKNCHSKGLVMDITAHTSEAAPQTYLGASGLVAGMWDGTMEGCSAEGSIKLVADGKAKGSAYVGGLVGEAFCIIKGCTSHVNVEASFAQEFTAEAYVSGLAASSTDLSGSRNFGSAKVSGGSPESKICLAGVSGSERYGELIGNSAQCTLEANCPGATFVGGVFAEFSPVYGFVGVMLQRKETLVQGNSFEGSISADNCPKLTSGTITGVACPPPAVGPTGSMPYRIA